jgi:hypothetical protein
VEAFDALGALAPAELPAALVLAAAGGRPALTAGGQPAASVVLAEITVVGGTTLRIATAGYATRPSDTPASTLYEPRLLDDVTLSQSAADAFGIGGVVALAAGEVRLADGDDALAALDRYGTADARAIRLRTVTVADPQASDFGTPFAATQLAFAGLVRGVYRAPGRTARLAFGDSTELLAVPLQGNRYAGTGGAEGGADLAGQPKPVCLGRCFNVAPVFLGIVDLGAGSLPTYQVHWRAVQSIDEVRIRGVVQSLTAGTPGIGQARAYAASGLFQLGSSPDGTVRADVRGDNVGGYVNTAPAIVQRLLMSLGPTLTAGDFDTNAWTFAEAALGGEVGWYRGAEVISAAGAAGQIVAGAGAVLAGARGGQVRLFDPLDTATAAQFALDVPQIVELRPLELPAVLRPLPSATAVSWRPNWGPISDAAGAVAASTRQALAAAASGPARATGPATAARQAVGRDLAFAGLYWNASEAAARAAKWQAWIDLGPTFLEVTTDQYLGQVAAGDIGRVTYPAYGLAAGVPVVVLAIRERLGGRRLTLTCATLPES